MKKASITIEQIRTFFVNSPRFRISNNHRFHNQNIKHSDCELAGFLTPARPTLIHIIEHHEINFLRQLTSIERQNFFTAIVNNCAHFLIIHSTHASEFKDEIPPQLDIVTPCSDKELSPISLEAQIHSMIYASQSEHGAFVVVFNQGILITGDSGAGKSQALLSLVDRGHLWVADDAPRFSKQFDGTVIGYAAEHLTPYVHVKSLGAIDMEKAHGKACQIPKHSLAGVIQLCDNVNRKQDVEFTYTQTGTHQILGTEIPLWRLQSNNCNLTIMIENCAKQIILNQWNESSADSLDQTLQSILNSQVIE